MATYDTIKDYDSITFTYNGTAVTTYTVTGIHGMSQTDGTEKLIVIWNNVPKIYSSGAWTSQALKLTSANEVYFENFLNGTFMVNGGDANYFYNGTTWSATTNLTDSPKGQFVKEHLNQLYLYKINIGGTDYPSRVWRSDLPKNGAITWGLETGSDLAQTASSAVITSAGSLFKTRNIKVGDPILITSGDNAGEYTVQSVDSETQITLTATLVSNATNSSFWVGSNWFDVATDDGDYGMGIGETSNELFFFKKNSVYRYNALEEELRKVKTAPGTTSPRSIVSYGSYCYWFHPSGIYRTAGTEEQLISSPISDVVDSCAIPTQVVGWANLEEDTLNFYLGNCTTREGDSIRNCVAVFDVGSNIMYFKSYPTAIRCATTWLESNEVKIYGADDVSAVYQLDTGTDFNDVAIPFELELRPVFPQGSETMLNFTRLRAYINNGPDVQIFYKLLYKPTPRKDTWTNDLDWKPLKGAQKGDRSEWVFPPEALGCGVKLKAVESSTKESFLLEKLVIYYTVVGNR